MLSYSEISTAQTCAARWDYAYGGRLAGSTLRRKQVAAILSNGRAWGAAVATWHALCPDGRVEAMFAAHDALRASYAADVAAQREKGIIVPALVVAEALDGLHQTLDHYMHNGPRLENLTRLEGELDLPIPAANGSGRPSNRYRFGGYIDGFTVDANGYEWIVEFKLRDNLTPVELIQLSRQIRWYAWARQQTAKTQVVGCIVIERLADFPKPARMVKGKRKDGPPFVPSHAKDQITTPSLYAELCEEYGESPHPDILVALDERRWYQRVPILFRPDELDEAGMELASAARLIRDLDNGSHYPIRNAQPQLCRGCRYKSICANPQDTHFVDIDFERDLPKRDRPPKTVVTP